MRTKRTSPFLGCEALESRANPAGNVSAFASGTEVFVVGDGNAFGNQVVVSQDGVGNVFVIGIDGTTVNGQDRVLVYSGIPTRLSIQLPGAGRDVGVISGLTANNVDITTGAGDDSIGVENMVADTVLLSAGTGNDAVELRDVSAGFYVAASGGDGIDAIYVGTVNGPFGYNGFEAAYPSVR